MPSRPRIDPWPFGKRIAFAIRDDDLSRFARVSQVEQLYSKAWERGFKVSFAAVPMIRGVNKLNVPPEHREDHSYHDIRDNGPLVASLRQRIGRDQVAILQHGWCHARRPDLPTPRFDFDSGTIHSEAGPMRLGDTSEFANLPYPETEKQVLQGRSILEDAFGIPIRMFVPPQERMTRALWRVLKEHDYSASYGPRTDLWRYVPPRHLRPIGILRSLRPLVRHPRQTHLVDRTAWTTLTTIPATHRHYWNSHRTDRLSSQAEEAFARELDRTVRASGAMVLLTHFWEYFYDWAEDVTQHNQYDALQRALALVETRTDAWKCGLDDLADWMEARRALRVRSRGGATTLQTTGTLDGLVVRGDPVRVEPVSAVLERNEDHVVLRLEPDAQVTLRWTL